MPFGYMLPIIELCKGISIVSWQGFVYFLVHFNFKDCCITSVFLYIETGYFQG